MLYKLWAKSKTDNQEWWNPSWCKAIDINSVFFQLERDTNKHDYDWQIRETKEDQ